MAFAVSIEPAPVLRAFRLAADVVDVDETGGFLSSVYVVPDRVAVARLDRAIRGAAVEGDVRRWALDCCVGVYGYGLHLLYGSPDGALMALHRSPGGASIR